MNIRIGCLDFELCLVDDLHDKENHERLGGSISYEELIISIHKTLCTEKRWQVCIHEIVHGLLTACEIELEEKQVNLLSSHLAMFLRDNNLGAIGYYLGLEDQTNKGQKGDGFPE